MTNASPILKCLIEEPAEVYHTKAVDYLSSHWLADFRRCPHLYDLRQKGEVKNEDRPAYLLGHAAHSLILEGRSWYEAEYAIGGPINEKTGQPYGATTKAFAEWAAAQGKPVLSLEQAGIIERMNAAVRGHEIALVFLSSGVAERVVRTTWAGVACQARIDWISFESGAGIVDLKTTDDLTWFEADSRRYGYPHQLAFYRSILSAAAQIDPRDVPVHLIAVEKKEPFRAGVWRLGDEVLGIAQKENEEAVRRLRQCRQTGFFPTGYEDIRTFDWM